MKDIPWLVWQLVIKIEIEVANIKQSNIELRSDISALKESLSGINSIEYKKEIRRKLKLIEEELKELEQIIPEFRRRINELRKLIP